MNDRAYDLQDLSGHVCSAAEGDIYLLNPPEYIVYYQMQKHLKGHVTT